MSTPTITVPAFIEQADGSFIPVEKCTQLDLLRAARQPQYEAAAKALRRLAREDIATRPT